MAFTLPPRLRLEEKKDTANTVAKDRKDDKEGRSRKGQPWSETEHLQFLAGLKKLGRGNWRGISRLFVPSRSPTQVASHAQKYLLRQTTVSKRKSRFCLLEQAASAQGLLSTGGSAERCGVSGPLLVPVFYGVQLGQSCDFSGLLPAGSASTSDTSDRDCHPRQTAPSKSCPESTAAPNFTKICRPVPYHASARLTDMAKLRADLAAAVADDKFGTLQPSSRSAFFPVRPSSAISV
ncbi:g1703 [Coccomyxa elongata]